MSDGQYKIGECILDCQTLSLSRHEETYKLSAKVLQLLKLFLLSNEHVVSRKEAIEKIWAGNEAVGQRGFTNAIWTLRKAFKELGEDGDDVFITLPKIGYQLNLEISEVKTSAKKSIFITKEYGFAIGIFSLLLIAILFYSYTSETPSVKRIEHREHKKVTTFEGIEEHPAVSHSGQYVSFQWNNGGHNNGLYIQDLTNPDTPLNQVTMGNAPEVSPAWSENDESIAYVRVLSAGECQVRVRHLVTNNDVFIDDGCYYVPYRRVVEWATPNELIYTKKLDLGAALFSYNFEQKESKQLTFPQRDSVDFAPRFVKSTGQLFFIRDKSSQKFDILIQDKNMSVREVLKDKVTIVDIDVDQQAQQLFVNYAEDSKFLLKQISLNSLEEVIISDHGLSSNISLNQVDQKLLFSSHISKEYVAQIAFNESKVTRRISSSSRDMYGRLSPNSNNILFLSNRSGNWSVWANNGVTSKDLTKGLGNTTVPAVSPDGQYFAVSVLAKNSKLSALYIGDLRNNTIKKINTNGLEPDNPSWSNDGEYVYFSVSADGIAGIYKVNVLSEELVKLSQGSEYYLVEGADNNLYVSRANMNGIWRLEPETDKHTLITPKLDMSDYGAFFWHDDSLYFLNRNQEADQVIRISPDGIEQVISTFSPNSIRKFFGISKGDNTSFIATLKLSNESDINSVNIYQH